MVNNNMQENQFPRNVGIIAMEAYFPSLFVHQSELEKFDGVSAGKYTIGLGQVKLGFCTDREDIHSISLTVVRSLMTKYKISYSDIGRLEVGTETIIDKSKSVKTVLMQLFVESGNSNVEGIDTTNACYGGTAALLNALNWVESSSWDGRYALVVAGDIAVYASGSARPTGGCGVIAMLIGKDAPLVIERGLRGTHMEHVYDFYKPELSSEFPQVDGPLTISCYLRAVDICYKKYLESISNKDGDSNNTGLDSFDYFCFHSPYTKLVQKSFARLAFNDFLNNSNRKNFEQLQSFKDLKLEDTYFNKEVEKAFVELSKLSFKQKVEPTLLMAKQIGNMYCGSLYACLVSLICQVPSEQLLGKRIGMFSYGSGSAATMFSVRVAGDVSFMSKEIDLENRLNSRTAVEPAEFERVMSLREDTHNLKNYAPVGAVDGLFNDVYYLTLVDDKYRRSYEFKGDTSGLGN